MMPFRAEIKKGQQPSFTSLILCLLFYTFVPNNYNGAIAASQSSNNKHPSSAGGEIGQPPSLPKSSNIHRQQQHSLNLAGANDNANKGGLNKFCAGKVNKIIVLAELIAIATTKNSTLAVVDDSKGETQNDENGKSEGTDLLRIIEKLFKSDDYSNSNGKKASENRETMKEEFFEKAKQNILAKVKQFETIAEGSDGAIPKLKVITPDLARIVQGLTFEGGLDEKNLTELNQLVEIAQNAGRQKSTTEKSGKMANFTPKNSTNKNRPVPTKEKICKAVSVYNSLVELAKSMEFNCDELDEVLEMVTISVLVDATDYSLLHHARKNSTTNEGDDGSGTEKLLGRLVGMLMIELDGSSSSAGSSSLGSQQEEAIGPSMFSTRTKRATKNGAASWMKTIFTFVTLISQSIAGALGPIASTTSGGQIAGTMSQGPVFNNNNPALAGGNTLPQKQNLQHHQQHPTVWGFKESADMIVAYYDNLARTLGLPDYQLNAGDNEMNENGDDHDEDEKNCSIAELDKFTSAISLLDGSASPLSANRRILTDYNNTFNKKKNKKNKKKMKKYIPIGAGVVIIILLIIIIIICMRK